MSGRGRGRGAGEAREPREGREAKEPTLKRKAGLFARDCARPPLRACCSHARSACAARGAAVASRAEAMRGTACVAHKALLPP
jgi:hypothetical protein